MMEKAKIEVFLNDRYAGQMALEKSIRREARTRAILSRMGSYYINKGFNSWIKYVEIRRVEKRKMRTIIMMMQLSKLQGTWTYTRTAKEAPVKVTIEGDVVTWPQGQKAKITCGVNKIWLQFGGDSDSKTYFAEWGHDGALYWSDNAVWTRVALTPLKTGKFESVIQ